MAFAELVPDDDEKCPVPLATRVDGLVSPSSACPPRPTELGTDEDASADVFLLLAAAATLFSKCQLANSTLTNFLSRSRY